MAKSLSVFLEYFPDRRALQNAETGASVCVLGAFTPLAA
jgi:hypothetical protein